MVTTETTKAAKAQARADAKAAKAAATAARLAEKAKPAEPTAPLVVARQSRIATQPVATITRTSGDVHELGLGNGGAHGATRARDLVWCTGKQNVFAALAALGAIGSDKAVTAKAACLQAVAMGLMVTPRDVRHYTYHAACAGLAGCTIGGAGVGHTYYLTKAGQGELTKRTKA